MVNDTKRAWPHESLSIVPAMLAALVALVLPADNRQAKAEQSSWVKLCDTTAVGRMCLTYRTVRDEATGKALISAALREIDGRDTSQFVVNLPYEAFVPASVRMRIDDGTQRLLTFQSCGVYGCVAELPVSHALLGELRTGANVVVTATGGGWAVPLSIPLLGFAQAHDGPADADRSERRRGIGDWELEYRSIPYDPLLPRHRPVRPNPKG